MLSDELAALEKDIRTELSDLRAALASLFEERLICDTGDVEAIYDEIAARESDIGALEEELTAVEAKRCEVHLKPPRTLEEQIAALRAENALLSELRQLEIEISARQSEMKRLAEEISSLRANRRRLKLALRHRDWESQPDQSTASGDADSRMGVVVEKVRDPETVSLEALPDRNLIEDRSADFWEDEEVEPDEVDEPAGILKMLSPTQEQVIRMRFGIGCDREHTLEEVAQGLSTTPDQIRRIEAEALRDLRAPQRSRRFLAWLAAR